MTQNALDHDLPWSRWFLWLVAGVTLFRVAYLFTVVDFQLAGDETYYWDWGRQLDWGYFSKPPLIAWIMGLIRVTFGYTWWALRLTSILFGAGRLVLLFVLGRSMFGARTGFFAALLFTLTPASAGLSYALNTDPPLLLCWLGALVLFWRAVQAPQSLLRWIGLGVVIGIGALAKQMMLVFPLLMIATGLLVKEQRTLLRRPGFWGAMLLGAAFLLPTLYWNYSHGWPMVKHTAEANLGASNVDGFVDHVVSIVQFPLVQAAMFSPVTMVLMIGTLIACWRNWPAATVAERVLWVFSAPALGAFVLLSFYKEINPNWPAVFFMAALVLLASRAASGGGPWFKRALLVGLTMTALVYLYEPCIRVAGLRGHPRLDVFRDLRGWDQVGREAGAILARMPDPETTFVLVVDHRNFASQLAFWMPQHPRVYRWNRAGAIESQYEIWPDGSENHAWDALIVLPDDAEESYRQRVLPGLIEHSFRSVAKAGSVDIDIGNGTRRSMQFYLGDHMVRWPPTSATAK